MKKHKNFHVLMCYKILGDMTIFMSPAAESIQTPHIKWTRQDRIEKSLQSITDIEILILMR